MQCLINDSALPIQIPLLNVVNVERLSDPAKFVDAELARNTQHIRLTTDDQIAIDEVIDLYTIFEDSHIFCYLETAWLSLHLIVSWPEIGSQSRCELAFHLNINESGSLFRALREQILSGPNQTASLENIAMVIGVNQFVKISVFQVCLSSQFR